MTRSKAAALSAAALGTVLLAAGCGAGQVAQTAEMQPAVPGANSTPTAGADASIQLRNVLIAYPGVEGYEQGDNAPLELFIFNTGQRPVTLVEVTTDAARTAHMTGATTTTASPPPPSPSPSESPHETPTGSPSATPTGLPTAAPTASPSPSGAPVRVPVPVGGYVELSSTTSSRLELVELTRALRSGEAASIRFAFDNGATFTLDVPVGLPASPVSPGPPVVEEHAPEGAVGHG